MLETTRGDLLSGWQGPALLRHLLSSMLHASGNRGGFRPAARGASALDDGKLMLAGFSALIADDLVPVITLGSLDGKAIYWTGGTFSSGNSDAAARFSSAADAEATLVALNASGVIAEGARVSMLASWGDASAAAFRF